MKLYHFPSPNPQKVTFALLELGLDCEKIPVDLTKEDHREPAFLAVNPAGRVPVLVDDGVTLTESQAILAYLETRPAACGRSQLPDARKLCNGSSSSRSMSCQRPVKWHCGSVRA